MGATDRYVHPSQDRTIDEHHPPRSISSDLPPLPMPPMDITPAAPERVTIDTRDQFSIDALAFIKNAMDAYPIYGYKDLFYENIFLFIFFSSIPTKTVLLGVDCISSSDVPLIFVQEPTVIGADELAMPMDTLPPLDQVLTSFFFIN